MFLFLSILLACSCIFIAIGLFGDITQFIQIGLAFVIMAMIVGLNADYIETGKRIDERRNNEKICNRVDMTFKNGYCVPKIPAGAMSLEDAKDAWCDPDSDLFLLCRGISK